MEMALTVALTREDESGIVRSGEARLPGALYCQK